MVLASQLKTGMAIRHGGELLKVLSVDHQAGQGKMGGVTHAHLKNLETGTFRDHGFRPDIKLEDVPVEKVSMDFLYRDGEQCIFMNPETFEQIEIAASLIGHQANLLQEQMRLVVEFVGERPVSVQFPDVLEVPIAETAPPSHNQQDNTWKEAQLEGGVQIMVPQFVKSGDVIRLDVEKLQYVDRAHR